MTAEDWRSPIREPRLSPEVPAAIGRPFEAARDAMLQSPESRPLYTLGVEQFYRVAEAGFPGPVPRARNPSVTSGQLLQAQVPCSLNEISSSKK